MKINALFMPGIKLRRYRDFSAECIKKYLITINLALAVVSGVIVYMFNKEAINAEYSELFSEYCLNFLSADKTDIFISSLKNILPYILLMLLFSTSAVGDILVYMLTFIRFSAMSTYTAFLYTQYGIAGIKYCFTVFLPGKVIFIIGSLILIDLCIKIVFAYRHKNKLTESELKKAGTVLLIDISVFFLSLCVDYLTLSMFLPRSEILSLLG